MNVYEAAISGFDSYCVTPSDTRLLDSIVCRKLRIIAGGRAHPEYEYGSNSSWPNTDVMRYWN